MKCKMQNAKLRNHFARGKMGEIAVVSRDGDVLKLSLPVKGAEHVFEEGNALFGGFPVSFVARDFRQAFQIGHD